MLNIWDVYWGLRVEQCPCDVHFVEWLEEQGLTGKRIYHFGTGGHHYVGIRCAEPELNSTVLGITASPKEYEAFVKLAIDNPTITKTYSAYFGDYNNASETIYQTITVPSNGALSFWWYMTTQETSGTYDYLRVRLYNGSGGLIATLATFSNASAKNTWTQQTLSLAGYAGQTVRVQFEATTDGSLPSTFFVDDVSSQ